MYAVIATGGKQYRVEAGQTVRVEKLDVEVGKAVDFDQVLLMANGDNIEVGTPLLKKTVNAEVVAHGRGDKIEIIKFHRRKHHMKRQGHRQSYTELKIVGFDGKKVEPKKKETPVKKAAAKKPAAEKAVAKQTAEKKPAEKKLAEKKPTAKKVASKTSEDK